MARETVPTGAELLRLAERAKRLDPGEYMFLLKNLVEQDMEVLQAHKDMRRALNVVISVGIERGDEINKTQAAKVVGCSRTDLYKRIERL